MFVTVCVLTAVLSPLGMASMHAPGSIDMDDDKVYGGVVGKGKCPSLLHLWGVHSGCCGGPQWVFTLDVITQSIA